MSTEGTVQATETLDTPKPRKKSAKQVHLETGIAPPSPAKVPPPRPLNLDFPSLSAEDRDYLERILTQANKEGRFFLALWIVTPPGPGEGVNNRLNSHFVRSANFPVTDYNQCQEKMRAYMTDDMDRVAATTGK